jgi:hypothetical protein
VAYKFNDITSNRNGDVVVGGDLVLTGDLRDEEFVNVTTMSSSSFAAGGVYRLTGARTTSVTLTGLSDVIIDCTRATFASSTSTPISFTNCNKLTVYGLRVLSSANHGIVVLNSTDCKFIAFDIRDWTNSAVLCYAGSSRNQFIGGRMYSTGAVANNGMLHVDCTHCINTSCYVYGVTGSPGYAFQTKNSCIGVVYTACTGDNCDVLAACGQDNGTGSTDCRFQCTGKDIRFALYEDAEGTVRTRFDVNGNVLAASGGACALIGGSACRGDIVASFTGVTTGVDFRQTALRNIVTLTTNSSVNTVMVLRDTASGNRLFYEGPSTTPSVNTASYTGGYNYVRRLNAAADTQRISSTSLPVDITRDRIFLLTAGSAQSYTLPACTIYDLGRRLDFTSRSAFAHTITTTGSSFNGNTNVATFGGAVGDSLSVVGAETSSSTYAWMVVSKVNVTLS